MDIKDNIAAIRAAIPDHVTLVAVSKTQPQEALQAALDAGLRVFGENRVQEAREHWLPFKAAYPDVRLHLIGHLQTNKAKDAVAFFDVIESVDSERLADALAEEMHKQDHHVPCYIQVNTGDEPQKAGVAVADVPGLLAHCKAAGLVVTGLMCIPPAGADPAPHFALLAKMAKDLNLPHVSMGMSADYRQAIAQGATHVRVGSALFGARTPL
jgi:PLP dependent protein